MFHAADLLRILSILAYAAYLQVDEPQVQSLFRAVMHRHLQPSLWTGKLGLSEFSYLVHFEPRLSREGSKLENPARFNALRRAPVSRAHLQRQKTSHCTVQRARQKGRLTPTHTRCRPCQWADTACLGRCDPGRRTPSTNSTRQLVLLALGEYPLAR